MFDLPATTIRYYDKEGFFPNLHRGSAGVRQFSDEDIEVLHFVVSLRKAGMSINEIHRFLDLCNEGNIELVEKKKMLIDLEKNLNKEIEAAQQGLDLINKILEDETMSR